MSFDGKLQRQIFGRFPTGVTVVTVAVDGETRGMTANAVCSVSLEPALCLVCVAKNAEFHSYVARADGFALNFLTESQRSLSDRFAFTGPRDCSGLATRTAVTGAPLLPDTLAFVDCKVHQVLPGGDHDIYLGQIVAGHCADGGAPLLYYAGRYRSLAAES